MIEKPSACSGCPFQHYGRYFTPDIMVASSKVLFVAQNPDPDEEVGHWKFSREAYKQVQPQPLIGATGQLFNNKFLKEASLKRSEVSLANAIRCRPGEALGLRADALPPLTNKMKLETSNADIVKALKHCKAAYLKIPTSIKTIVTMGSYALYQQTGISNVTDWRGYALDYDSTDNFITVDTSTYHDLFISKSLQDCRGRSSASVSSQVREPKRQTLFVTMHIAALFKGENKKYYHATLADFGKLKKLREGSWPLPLPAYNTNSPLQWPKYAAFDTEYYWNDINRQNNNKLIRWSLCDTQYNLYCVESENTPYERIPIVEGSTVVIQNALADIAHLSHIVDVSKVNVEDMMLAHSVLWTGEPHSLNYIASVFGSLNRYKHLSSDQPQLYSALDAYEPMYIWRNSLIPDFKADKESWHIYKKYRLPLINIINKAQQTGAALDSSRLLEVQQILQERIASIKTKARAVVGDDSFSIGGIKRVKEEIYG